MENTPLRHAQWIWHEGNPHTAPTSQHELVYFRRTFHAPALPVRLVIYVSADSRYRLCFNGDPVAVGPCKGDGRTHYYETVDLSDRVKPGPNVLAAKVLHYAVSQPFPRGFGGPASVWRSASGAFLLEGALIDDAGGVIEALHTDEQWRCLMDTSLTFAPERFTLFAGGTELVDGARIPHGWDGLHFDESRWAAAVPFFPIMDPGCTGELSPWQLAPRPIPPLFERLTRFRQVVRGEAAGLLTGDAVPVQPYETFVAELDAGELATGYLQLAVSGGAGAVVRILCSECYEPYSPTPWQRNKGVRDDASNGVLLGEWDVYTVAGCGTPTRPETYEPFLFRTFRYLRLQVEAGSEPLTLHRFDYRDTGYPLQVGASFECSDPTLEPLWRISLNTLQRCMHETYEDCPYYEQLQYTMDTRLQALFTYHVSGDDRLARKALYDFHSSLLPSGMLQSRYPNAHPQVIPGFALHWVMMLADHYRHYGDLSLVRRYRPTVDAVLDWFDRRLTPEGLVGPAPDAYWSYVDWVHQWSETAGAPSCYRTKPLTVYNLMYAASLLDAASLLEASGRGETGAEYRQRAAAISASVQQHCWSPERGLFADGPGADAFSQHQQVWAVLAETVTGDEARALMERTLTEAGLAQASYSFSFFLFRALEKAGMYDRAFSLWETWRKMADLHLTTWTEDPVGQRSDCHAWGAVPLYEFPALILGVQPVEPGYARIRVAPQPGPLTWARGTVMTPRGPVHVDWRIDDQGKLCLNVNAPAGMAVEA